MSESIVRGAARPTWWERVMETRRPDQMIGGADDPYMLRWHLLRSNWPGNVYLHCFLRSDDDRALHDHPWWSISVMLHGACVEWTYAEPRRGAAGGFRATPRRKGDLVFRTARTAHRIALVGHEPCVTLFATGPRIREWGFHCPRGWVHWRDFTDPSDGGASIGRGCG